MLYYWTMNKVYIITAFSAINGNLLFLGAGSSEEGAKSSAYGDPAKRMPRDHDILTFRDSAAAVEAFPNWECDIMCELSAF